MIGSVLVVGIIILFLMVFPYFKYGPLKRYKNGESSAILVLGYPTKANGNLSAILETRVKKALELYKEGKAPYIICSGNAVKNQYHEAVAMGNYLKEHQVLDSAIIYDKEARNTYGNIVNAKTIMKEQQFDSLIIVSSPWHLRKASIYAEKIGLMNYTVVPSSIPKSFMIALPFIYIYLYFGIFKSLFQYK